MRHATGTLATATDALGFATSLTYNAFADRLIRDYGPTIGIEPEVALLSDAQAYLLIGRLLEELCVYASELDPPHDGDETSCDGPPLR